MNELNQPVPSGCVKVDNPDDSVFVEVEKLSPATAYHCYFMIYNDYPLWPANETEQGAISF